MTLGIALLIIFILYLVDKHHRWMPLVKITAALVVLGVLGFGSFYGWIYEDAVRSRQHAANAQCAVTVGQGYTAVGVDDVTPLGMACTPPVK
jgi:hypothetical protein